MPRIAYPRGMPRTLDGLAPLVLAAALLSAAPLAIEPPTARPVDAAPSPCAHPGLRADRAQDDEGVVETSYPSGRLKERYEVDDDGEKDGLYERFREDGSVEVSARYSRGALNGTYEEFGHEGDRTLEAQYKRGEKDGIYRTYAGEVVTLDARYRRDVLNGNWLKRAPDGSHVIRAKYRRGVLDGRYVEERPAEEWERRANYDDGLLDGKATIRVDGDTVSEREWDEGRLVELDGIVPYPRTVAALSAELLEAGRPAEADASDPIGAKRQQALARLKAYRALCGVPWRDLELDAGLNDLCDAASEVIGANGQLSHEPPRPAGFDEERYRQGFEGASNSNIGTGGVLRSVDAYMDDSDPSNIDRVGHRRWCLNPPMGKTGFGESDGSWTAMWSTDSSGKGARGLDAVLYPPPGHVPTDMFGPRHAWSIHPLNGKMPSKDEDLVVRIHRLDGHYQASGAALELDYVRVSREGYGSGECIIFRPAGLEATAGARYRARISLDGGDRFEHDFLVEFIAPPEASDASEDGEDGDRR